MNNVEILIISSTLDYSTDLVCYELKKRNRKYLRINRDLFDQYKIHYSVIKQKMTVVIDEIEYEIDNNALSSVYFRAPVFNRYSKELTVYDQLKRGQWGSFIRNLIVFDKAKWINHPVATYKAENKVYQLTQAYMLGMNIPETFISNCDKGIIADEMYVVKALDTPVFYDNDNEMFTYSCMLNGDEIKSSRLQDAPVIIQKCLSPKLDLRITVVGEKIYPAKILYHEKMIEGDWRKNDKEGLSYLPTTIPDDLIKQILQLMNKLELSFGGLDFAIADGKYYFIEVNPTGEWEWLVETAGFPIDKTIADTLEDI